MPNSPDRYSSFEVPSKPQERKNMFDTTGPNYPKGRFRVEEFDLSCKEDVKGYEDLMNEIYSDKARFFDIRREVYNYEYSRFVRIECFEVEGKTASKKIKSEQSYSDLISGAMNEIKKEKP